MNVNSAFVGKGKKIKMAMRREREAESESDKEIISVEEFQNFT